MRFEPGKVEVPEIRERMVTVLNQIDGRLAERVANGLGIPASIQPLKPLNQSVPADGDVAKFQPKQVKKHLKPSPELSIVLSTRKDTIRTRKIAILTADGCEDNDLNQVLAALTAEGAQAKIVAPRLGYLRTKHGNNVKIHCSLLTASSVLFDAVYVPGGEESIASLKTDPAALEFVSEAYKHAKAIAASGAGTELLRNAHILNGSAAPDAKKKQAGTRDEAVVVAQGSALDKMVEDFIMAIGKHRNWQREKMLRPDLQS